MKGHRVTLIPGDGTSPELLKPLAVSSRRPGWARVGRPPGGGRRHGVGRHAAPRDPRLGQGNSVALKGPITTPIGTGFRSVNVALRHEIELYACLRPCKTYQGVRSRYQDVDIVIVRENTEDLPPGHRVRGGDKSRQSGSSSH